MLSVVIPTHNRAAILKICLERLLAQKGVEFEVIVVDDGSTDDTEGVVGKFQIPNSKFQKIQYFKQPNSQQGVARNRGVEATKGDIIVFIGDDIFVEPDFLKQHAEAHQVHREANVVVLGYTTWDPALPINDYMRFLESSGWQFGYGFLRPGFVERADRYKFFYTSNLSLKKSFFEKEKFNETFRGYGWEDIELGYRLFKNHQMRLFYEPAARAYHHHLMTEADLSKKMQTIGHAALFFQELHPELTVVPRGPKKWLIKIATFGPFMALGRLLGKSFYYKLWSWKEFFRK